MVNYEEVRLFFFATRRIHSNDFPPFSEALLSFCGSTFKTTCLQGGEHCLLHGDDKSEWLLSEIVGASPIPEQRHMNMESLYEYGSRAGFWRLHRLLTKYKVPTTVYAVGMALERNPEAAKAMVIDSISSSQCCTNST